MTFSGLILHAVHWVSVSPKSVCCKPNPLCNGVRWWGLGLVIRTWGWVPHEWDQCPYRRDPESSLAFPLYEDTARRRWLCVRSRALSDSESVSTLILDLQPPHLWQTNVSDQNPVFSAALLQQKHMFLQKLTSKFFSVDVWWKLLFVSNIFSQS